MELILIGICTYNRNELLENALNYISKLDVPTGCKLSVVISDNNTDEQAKQVYEKFKSYPFNLYYVHEQRAGIAYARNAVLQKALDINADYVAFIDDDEYPKSNWITELYSVMKENNASGATSAPIQISEGKELPLPNNVKKRKRGEKRRICITNSVIFSTKIIKDSNLWFDTDFGLMTGEDIDFFSRASDLGYKFVWNNKLLLYDFVPANRLTLEWQLDRTFNDGYLKIFLARKEGKKSIHKILTKTLIEIIIFSFTFLVCSFNKRIKNKCLFKIMDCTGKIKSIYSNKSYEHYKR